MSLPIRRALQHAMTGFSDDELLTRAAAIAFYSALSMAPIILLAIWTLSLLGPQWQDQLIDELARMMGHQAADAVIQVIQSAKAKPMPGNIAGFIGIGVTLFSASAVFAQLQNTLNRIWRIDAPSHDAIGNWLKARARAIGLLVGVSFLLIVSFAVSLLIHLFMRGDTAVWSGIEYFVTLVVFVAAFAAMYRILPDTDIDWRDALWGGLLTTMLFTLGKFGIELYIQHASVGGAYGPAGGLVVMLTWVYYASFVVLLGAELTHGIAQARQRAKAKQPVAHLM